MALTGAVIAIVVGIAILVVLCVLWRYIRRAEEQPPAQPYQPNRAGRRVDRTRRWELTGDPDITQVIPRPTSNDDTGKDPDKR